MLGGAGPAVASVPLTVLWASGSAFTLVRSIAGGGTGPLVAMQQVGRLACGCVGPWGGEEGGGGARSVSVSASPGIWLQGGMHLV